jgi:hypothetical protein
MRFVVVPDTLRDAINRQLDEAYEITPGAAVDREAHYAAILQHFDEHGRMPSSISFEPVKPN